MKILLIEDDIPLQNNIRKALEIEGYQVESCFEGDEGLYYLENNSCDLVILDRMLPGLDGISILQAARKQSVVVPVLMLSAMGSATDKITGLDAGADDYLAKPFELGELLARIRALARRPTAIEQEDLLEYEDLVYTPYSQTLKGPKGEISLSGRESAMMELFMRSGGGLITRRTIFNRVWGLGSDAEESNIATYVHFLRRRLLAVGSCTQFINHRAVGFSLEPAQDLGKKEGRNEVY